MATSSFGEFLVEEAAISYEQLHAALILQRRSGVSEGLGEALVQTGALSAWQIEPYLAAYERAAHGPTEFVSILLCDRPRSTVLEVITNQFVQSLRNALGSQVAADSSHSEADKVRPCDYTIYQAFTGDFEGTVYLNLSADSIVQIASTLVKKEAASPNALIAGGACAFLDIANGNVRVQLSTMGKRVGLGRPLFFCRPSWGERVCTPLDLASQIGEFDFTSVSLAHRTGRQELCIVDRTDESGSLDRHR